MLLTQDGLKFVRCRGVVLKVLPGVVAALAEAFFLPEKPRSRFLNHAVIHAQVPEQQRMYIFQTGGPHSFRPIYMDVRAHPKDSDPSYYGHSVGKWEGDTLVIDTVGVKDTVLGNRDMPHSDQMRIQERIRRYGLPPVRLTPRLEMYGVPGRVQDAAATPTAAEAALRFVALSQWLSDLESQDRPAAAQG